ncbi:hypothetical protein BAL199_00942 [alpha proteobacterium BAL199]|jgi:hypothetical protein|nr:hypothetical protein BAL199_00942 [alpha proteobacterium BAL199]
MSDHLPVTLSNLHEDAKKSGDRITTFRSYVKLLNAAYKALEKARDEARLADRHLNGLKVDYAFFIRHKGRVEATFRALRDSYRNPAKALRMIDELAANYPAQYVYEVCQLGSYRFGGALGWSFVGVRSTTRIEADRNYVDIVIPTLAQMLPDHAGYLALRSKDVEGDYEAALSDATHKRAVQAAIETTVPGWSEELTSCSLALTTSEIDQLTSNEREVRRRLMPIPKSVSEET